MFGSLLMLLSAGIIGLVGYVWIGNYLRPGGGGGGGGGSAAQQGPKTPGTLSGKPSRASLAAGKQAGAGTGGSSTPATPPPLPRRTEAQTAQMAKEAAAREAAQAKAAAEAAKAAADKAAKELKQAGANEKEAAKVAAAQAAAKAKESAAKEAAASRLALQREKEAKDAAAAAEKERIAVEKAEAKRAADSEAERVQAERDRVQAEKERHLRDKERGAAEKEAAEKKAAKAASLLSMAMAAPPALPKRPMLNILHAPTLTESVAFSPSPRDNSTTAGGEPSSARSSSSGSVGGDATSKAAKAEEHRQRVLWEIVASEEKYISSLNVLMDVFFRPLKVKADKGSYKLSPAEHALLFSNVEAIWRFHLMMLPALKTSPDGNVASVLQAHADFLKLYNKYVSDYTQALQTVDKLYKRESFVRMIKKQCELPAADGLDLMSYLIMPVQRVPRYLLLLKELQKWTPVGHPHSSSLDSAIAKVGKIATLINEETRAQENASLLLQFQLQIQQRPDDVVLFQPHRRLVRHGLLKLVKQEGTTVVSQLATGQNYQIILFNDMILYTTVDWVYGGSLKLQDAQLNVDGLMVEVLKEKTASRRAQMSLRLQCPSAEEATRWTQSMRDSIRAANELGLQDEKRRAFNSAAFVR